MIPRVLPEIHVGDYGTIIEFQIRRNCDDIVDISSATTLQVLFMKPDRTTFIRPAIFSTTDDSSIVPGSDGKMRYVLNPGDIDIAGDWFIQAYIEINNGAWYTSVIHFIVFPNVVEVTAELLTQ